MQVEMAAIRATLDWFRGLNPVMQAALATCFAWGSTTLGAACVFFARDMSRKLLNTMLGFAAGVMISVVYWSLLAPAVKMSQGSSIPAAIGFIAGGAFLLAIDKTLPHLHGGVPTQDTEGIKTSWQRSVLLVLAVTLHNVPEGLAIGVAFGAAAAKLPAASFGAAVALALGIAIQDIPEGLIVSMPLRREGMSRLKSFWWGLLSGVVEPVGAVFGAAAVMVAQPFMPYAYAFSAGAMIYVVIEELIPESQSEGNSDLATIAAMVGFTVMMILDVALG